MKLVCPHCKAVYLLAEKKIGHLHIATTTCRRCQGTIQIVPRSAESGPPVSRGRDLDKILETFPILGDSACNCFDLTGILTPDEMGGYATRENALRVRLIQAISRPAGKILKKQERVLHIGTGAAYFPARLPTNEASQAMLYTRCAILSTDRRLLLFNIDAQESQKADADAVDNSAGLLVNKLVHYRHRGKPRFCKTLERCDIDALKQCVEEVAALQR